MCSSLAWEEVGTWREQVGGTGHSWVATAARRDTWGMCPRGEDLPCGSLGRRRQRLRTTYLKDVEVVRTSPVGEMVQTRGEEKRKDLEVWWIGHHSEECCSTSSMTGVVYPEKEGSKGGSQNEAARPSGS